MNGPGSERWDGGPTRCPRCGQPAHPADRFCESCGAAMATLATVAIPRAGRTGGACADCGGPVADDGYCTVCGQLRAEPDRDEATLGGIAVVTDRGISHARNEDAAAAGILTPVPDSLDRPPHALAVVVCDGVSSSINPQVASAAAAQAGVASILDSLSGSRDATAAMFAGLADAARAAAQPEPRTGIAGSCTFTAVIVIPAAGGTATVTIGNVGDSRSYWLPDPPAVPQQLTVDDSLAQELISAGAAAQSEAVLRGAHTLTRWLGADSEPTPWAETSVRTLTVTGPGVLVVCSDGLWNYLPEAGAIREFCTDADLLAVARALTDFALQSGGQDNITVAVIPIGGTS
ncbi:protein phosphatase 2C domain-containing protein [Mycolicibacterium fluoranthenivorans]|uniref:Protein phosphatase 2C domain-containing protein n=1 Tax=Mycolicibacterium fluoranthenivorans TaxID=258505 RepID=A0A7G8P7Z6_9MYCO|nr:protein phosphatase 2C domain-containing protein [Mycolicibacterium fluoranthenivorans]